MYVANIPGADFDVCVDVSIKLKKAGIEPVPHLVARKIDDVDKLKSSLDRLTSAGCQRILLLAGDTDQPMGPFQNTLELLQTGIIQDFDLKSIGVAGHPEGNPYSTNQAIVDALKYKNEVAKKINAHMYVIAQLTFESEPVISWLNESNATGNKLPCHVGLAGPTKLKSLINYSKICGVGASLRALTKKTSMVKNLLMESTPDEMIVDFAKYKIAHPDFNIEHPHFFAFAGPKGTTTWANKVVKGEYEFNKRMTGFKLNE
jgi:methylenetetrahydrofolate reductase (NADPH)